MTDLPVVCCDLDGVLWLGDEPIPGAAAGIDQLETAGLRVGYLSNNSSHTVAEVVDKLGRCGIETTPDRVLTSALAAADLLSATIGAGARVLVCAGPGVVEALDAAGFELVREGPAAAVVVGFHDFDFEALDRASAAVRGGARLVATSLDPTYPVPGGLLPGTGSIVAAIATASGREPEVAGKPSPAMAAMVRRRLGGHGVIVGDRPSTDGAVAATLGWPFALVLSGVTAALAPPGGEAIPDPPPPFVAADLGALAPVLVATLGRPS